MSTALVIHGHFYQPPRENPWTGEVDREPSAHPDPNWNERIFHECYRPNGYARLFGEFNLIERIVNNYARMSFNFGPTLLSWMEGRHPATYARILEADRQSKERLGHGGAIAQGYNHTILPLCNDRDRVTQVRWGISDFMHRFGRRPESLWLPETGCNDATLGTLIDEGLRFVILSPYQAERVRSLGGGAAWREVGDGSIDPGQAYKYLHKDGSGRSIAIFFYDGPISRSIAFEGSLASSQALVRRLAQAGGGEGRLVHIATDGESYGHHSKFGDLALAHALLHEAPQHGFDVTNYSAFLEGHPPTTEVEIKAGPGGEGTAWSCAHGVGRWCRDCGCHTGAQEGWNQAWRGPLRSALNVLRDRNVKAFENEGGDLFRDPWEARDHYVELVLDRRRSRDEWLKKHARKTLSARDQERALTLLEIQRNAMLMYTSCGWFFADISGIETIQVMKYAGRVLDLEAELGLPSSRDQFLAPLSEARSNLKEHGHGADLFTKFVEPLRASTGRVAAHLGIMGLVDGDAPEGTTAGHRYVRSAFQKQRHGRISMATGRVELEDVATGKRADYALAAMHLGGVDFYCVCRAYEAQHFQKACTRLWAAFRTATLPQLLRMAEKELGPDEYGLDNVFQEGQNRVSEMIYGNIVSRFSEQYMALFESNQRILEMLEDAGLELPDELVRAAEYTMGRRFEEEIRKAHGSFEPHAYDRALAISEEARRRGYRMDTSRAGRMFGRTLAAAISATLVNPSTSRFAAVTDLANLTGRLGLSPNLVRAQEVVHSGFETHPQWLESLRPLARAVGVRLP
jgi:alpha-amylase/alpha-mannosidase (GH57 family)